MSRVVPFLDLSVQAEERKAITSIVAKVLEHGQIVLGPEAKEFENRIAAYCNRKYAVGVGSGSDAVYLALRALGIGKGDEVITTSLSWIATANAIALTNATPVFADINNDLNISTASVRNLITPKTKAILSVDYTGKLADVNELVCLAQENSLYLVEDGSQAFGAVRDGFVCGSYGDISAISHNPMKVLSAIGEAGSVLTNNAEFREKLISLRYNGTINKEWLSSPSINGRIDTIQAAILNYKIDSIDQLIKARQFNASLYDKYLNTKYLSIPVRQLNEQQVFYTYTIQADRRDELLVYLQSKGIECKIQHPILMSEQEPFRECRSETSNAYKIKNRIISLPIHEKLHTSDIEYICKCINHFYVN